MQTITQPNFVDLAFALIVLLSLVGGVLRGFTWQLVRIVFLVLAFVLANEYCAWMASQIRQVTHDGIGSPVDKGLAFVLIFSAVYLGSWPLASLLRSAIEKMKLKSFDRLLGACLGIFKGAAIGYVLFLVLAFLVPKAYPGGSRVEEQLVRSYSFVGVSRVDPVVRGLLPDEFHAMVAELADRVDDAIDGTEEEAPDGGAPGEPAPEPGTIPAQPPGPKPASTQGPVEGREI
jgi:membrane protein required for colicin V production